MKHQKMDFSHIVEGRACQKKQEIADKLKEMRKGKRKPLKQR